MKILIIGVNGQDGSIAYDHYQKLGHQIVGVTNPNGAALSSRSSLKYSVQDSVNLDLTQKEIALEFLNSYSPDRILNFAAIHASSDKMSQLEESKKNEILDVNFTLNENLLNWLAKDKKKTCRIAISLSSHMYTPLSSPTVIDENTQPNPSTAYGFAKFETFNLIKELRTKSEIYATGSILFTHSSIRSKQEFLLMQIAQQISQIQSKKSESIKIRDIEAYVDISLAHEVVLGVILSLEQNFPEDFVFSSGKEFTIKSIIKETLEGLQINSEKIELESTLPNTNNFRLLGNPKKAELELGWEHKTLPHEILMGIVKQRSETQ
jgi:GDP-D-mannose dehydratase